MKFKFIALNALLTIGILGIVWQARIRVREAHARREANLNIVTKPIVLPPSAPAPKPEAVSAAKYADIATKDLFAKDRNPVVIVDPPKIEKPKEMPPLPVVYGVLGLPSGTKAIMAEKATVPSAPVREGDTVGEFTIVSLDPENVTFGWNGEKISRKINDLIDRSGPPDNTGGGRASVQANPSQMAASQVQTQQIRPSNNSVQANNVPAGPASLGPEIGPPGESQRACNPSDNSPAGTVVDGYKKTLIPSPFGSFCRWVPAK